MTDPITVGALVAWALGLGGEAIVKGAVGEAVKDAYQALKTRVSRWAAGDVEALENTPNSNTRQAVIAETVNQLSREDQEALRDLAQALAGKLKEQAPAIGLDVGRLDALEVQLGNISARQHHGDARHGHTHPGGAPAGDVQDGRYFSRPVTRKTVTAPESSQAAAAIGVQFAGETRIGTLMHQTNDPEIAANVRELLAIARRGGIFSAAEQNAISEAAVRAVVEKAGSIGIAANDLISWLEGWIADVLAERAARQRGSNEGPAFAAVQREAQRRFNIGRLDDTSQAFIEELEREERAERERQEERARGRLRLLEAAIEWDRLALNGPAAAAKLRRMAAIEHPNDVDAQARLLFDRAGEFYDQGEFKGDNAALLVAIAAFRAALEEWTRERAPLEWAMTQNNLGNALATLGQRESGTARLEEAVSAYRAALEEWTRERAPLDWAETQNNLGNALRTLGERESGTARLEEAVSAYRAALEEWTRERAPLDWAGTQNNLGNALATLGQRESGTARLEEAVSAYRAALEEWTRERVPLDWAGTQNNLGNALATLGQRESGTARLEEAVSAYRAALEEWTRERGPLQWAGTQNNLGTALWTLGERESGTARLEEAVSAYRAALEEWTRERAPLDWAMTQNNLGSALEALGERESGTARLEEAVVAYDGALAIFVAARADYYESIFRKNRDRARAILRPAKELISVIALFGRGSESARFG